MNTHLFFKKNILKKYKNKKLIIINNDNITKDILTFINYTKETPTMDAALYFKDLKNIKYTITSNVITKIIYEHKLTSFQKYFIHHYIERKIKEKYIKHKIVDYLEGYEQIYKK